MVPGILAKAQRRKGATFLRAFAPLRLCVVLLAAAAVLGQGSDGWRQAAPGREFAFPADHASHPEYKIEWWYYTGNLDAADGRRFGYQLTFFRIGVDPNPKNPSRWAVRDLFMTHLAVTDVDGRTFRFAERVNRAGVGWAGAATDGYRVWNEDWEATLDAATGRHRLRAAEAGLGVDLELEATKPAVLHGARGYSPKGAGEGNASNYYSLTRMETTGTVTVEGRAVEVAGLSWMDHEFGTSFLEAEQQGWDWLSMQLDDDRELMLYQLRRGDGSRDPRSSGTLVERDGRTTHLAAGDFALAPVGSMFKAPSGATYPIRWTIRVPAQDLTLDVTTPLANQELSTAGAGISYWEGAIDLAGTTRGKPIAGRGYLEMTGYKGSLGRVLSGS